MNERIKELAEQQGFTGANYLISSQELKKFAELIVRECVDIASKYDEPKMSGPGLMIGHMIEQHFGVTE